MKRPWFTPALCVAVLAGPVACDAVSEGEGEGEAAEGEGEPPLIVINHVFQDADGASIDDDVLTLPEHDATAGPLDVDVSLHNAGAEPFELLTSPPLLVGGGDRAFFSVITQPATLVPAGESVPFTLRYAPATAGEHEGTLLFAYGVQTLERATLTVVATAVGPSTATGVRYAAFEGTFLVLPDFDALGASETGVLAGFDISSRVDDDDFAFLFEGVVQIDAGGAHTFFLTSDDGSRLLIDGAVVVDNDGQHGALEESGAVELTAGAHDIRVEYFEAAGAASLAVEWQGPGFARQAVPADRLFTD